jgi:hypothetical protein
MNPIRVIVTPRGNGYVAKSTEPEITALGSSAERAAENARLTATAMLEPQSRPSMLLVRINEPKQCTIVMQPIDKVFTMSTVDEAADLRYLASVAIGDPPQV